MGSSLVSRTNWEASRADTWPPESSSRSSPEQGESTNQGTGATSVLVPGPARPVPRTPTHSSTSTSTHHSPQVASPDTSSLYFFFCPCSRQLSFSIFSLRSFLFYSISKPHSFHSVPSKSPSVPRRGPSIASLPNATSDDKRYTATTPTNNTTTKTTTDDDERKSLHMGRMLFHRC